MKTRQLIEKSFLTLALLLLSATMAVAQSSGTTKLRRPITPERPLWIIHVDTWNAPDPERIIELVPEDIRPYCVFSISLSATDATCHDGYAVCDSWLKALANARVWSMVQCASGSHSRFSDHDLTVYEDYYRKYPNFIGWNFAEQFWGFGDEGQPTFLERLALFGEILDISQRYGGYLVVSFTQAYYSADMMPTAYMKRNAKVRKMLTEHPENFICCEKYTMKSCFYEIESQCLGAWLGGYAGQYGIRFDACGWLTRNHDGGGNYNNNAEPFVKASGAMPIMEHVLLTGETVIDGPETIPVEVSREKNTIKTEDGYTRRQWGFFPHFVNINIDEFRKILDGTVRIPTRREVIDRTKICIKNDYNDGSQNSYIGVGSLFDGLYRPECDHGESDSNGNKRDNPWLDNHWWLKITGRYPAIPQLCELLDEDAKRLEVVLKSGYNKRWPTVEKKVEELNKLFPEEYTGDIYAAHHENTWMTYNPYQYDDKLVGYNRDIHIATKTAKGNVPFQYNTAESIDLEFSPYSMAVVKEFPEKVHLYMTNYRNSLKSGWGAEKDDANFIEEENATDIVRIRGAKERPVVTWKDRANHRASEVKETWENGVLTLEVSHNGPLDIDIECSGNATRRKSTWTEAKIEVPELPGEYLGTLQWEAEHFDYKSMTCYGNAYNNGNRGYQGQGFVYTGAGKAASLRRFINVSRAGRYNLYVRYISKTKSGKYNLKVNGTEMQFPVSKCTEWTETEPIEITLNKGENEIMFYPPSTGTITMYLDCIKLKYLDAEKVMNNGLTVGRVALDDISQTKGVVEDAKQFFNISGNGLENDVVVSSKNKIVEFSFLPDAGFAEELIIDRNTLDDDLPAQPVYVRAKANTDLGEYKEQIVVKSGSVTPRYIDVNCVITPQSYTLKYDFEGDEASEEPTTPPANGVSVGEGNAAKAGVVSFTDAEGEESNMLKIYSASGSKHATGALTLHKFTEKATDYSVTWRQVLEDDSRATKAGVVLRAQPDKVGTDSKGYTQGLMNGYYFSVYNHDGKSEFRIYKSTDGTNLSMINIQYVDALTAYSGMSLWYRASVSGSTNVKLLIEYSEDGGETWQKGAETTDNAASFKQGATQIAWGLDAADGGFLMDDIVFNGITYDDTVGIEGITADRQYNTVHQYFDMSGRQIQQPSNGVYIERIVTKDGKKTVRKVMAKQ